MDYSKLNYFINIIREKPQAKAIVKGSDKFPHIQGTVWFYQTDKGVLVATELWNLPANKECNGSFLAFHIHSGESCSGNSDDYFADAGTHLNLNNKIHPCHTGDLAPILENNGYAFEIFLTNRFTVDNIIGKTVIVHSNPDDFTTQPSGNAGEKIACGIIKPKKQKLPRHKIRGVYF